MESLDNLIIDLQIPVNWRVCNSRKNHMFVILIPNYPHSVSNFGMNFAQLVIANQSILWNSLTFLLNFLISWFFLVFQVAWQPWWKKQNKSSHSNEKNCKRYWYKGEKYHQTVVQNIKAILKTLKVPPKLSTKQATIVSGLDRKKKSADIKKFKDAFWALSSNFVVNLKIKIENG